MASDALREAYVVPFDKILLDIKDSLGAVSICLPTRSEISAWRGSLLDSISELPSDPISELPSDSISELPSPSIDSGYVSMLPTPEFIFMDV